MREQRCLRFCAELTAPRQVFLSLGSRPLLKYRNLLMWQLLGPGGRVVALFKAQVGELMVAPWSAYLGTKKSSKVKGCGCRMFSFI